MVQEGGYIVLNNTNFINNGTFNAGTGTILIEGDATNANSAIGGATQTTFYNMVLDKTSNGSQLEQAINISNQLTLTSGNLDLQTYGENPATVYFGWILMLPNNPNHPDYRRHFKKKGYLAIRRNLPYAEFTAADESRQIAMMAETFLRTFREMRKIPQFEQDAFCRDLEALFLREGILS